MKASTSIVLGLFFGDEGKGLTTSTLSDPDSLVVRFNGGHQAAHSVENNGYRHVFSNIGSGTLKGATTYWSEYCTFHPPGFYKESAALQKAGYRPAFFIHPMAMVTTPFDVVNNRSREKQKLHGSLGLGFGATVARHTETPYKLHVADLFYRPLLLHKLHQIASYYGATNYADDLEKFLHFIDTSLFTCATLAEIKNNYTHIIFEGAQGIMLDQDFGFFPHVTRSHTTSKNAMTIIRENGLPEPHIYYVMRSYLTRHGNGPLPGETSHIHFDDPTNVANEYQGPLRFGFHSYKLLQHALSLDYIYSGHTFGKKHIVINCLDQTDNFIMIANQKIPLYNFVNQVPDIRSFFFNRSPVSGMFTPFIKSGHPYAMPERKNKI